MLLILSIERFIDKWVEVRAFTLVWLSWRIVDHVSGSMVPSVIVVFINGQLVVDSMNVDVFNFMSLSHFWKTFDHSISLFETWSKNKSFVRIFSTISKNNFVFIWVIWCNSCANISSGPVINLRRYSSRLKFEWRNMSMGNWIISFWKNESSLFSDKSHLKVLCSIFLLDELHQSSRVKTT